MAVGLENGIVAEPGCPARRKDEVAVDPALESLDPAIRPGERQYGQSSANHTCESAPYKPHSARNIRGERMNFDNLAILAVVLPAVIVPVCYTIWWTNKHEKEVNAGRRHQDIYKPTRR
jgi:hypothetical protein